MENVFSYIKLTLLNKSFVIFRTEAKMGGSIIRPLIYMAPVNVAGVLYSVNVKEADMVD